MKDLTDKQVLIKLRKMVKEYKEEYYLKYQGEPITNRDLWEVIYETVVR